MEKVNEQINTIITLFDMNKYKDAGDHAGEVLKLVTPGTKEYLFIEGIRKLCAFLADENENMDINSNLKALKENAFMFEWARLKRMEAESLFKGNDIEVLLDMAQELPAIEEVFKNAGAKTELERIKKTKEWIMNEILQKSSSRTISLNYLGVFNRIGEIVAGHLYRDDFGEKLLDILLTVTNSERGALFFVEGSELCLIAGRNMEHETIADAVNMSRTVVRKSSERAEVICCSDAITDPRFKRSKSILLNKIHSIICAPLQVGEKILGAVYLDSRYKHNLYSDEDRRFILTVTHFMSSLIERSRIYKKIEEENVLLRSIAADKTTSGCLVGKSPAICEIRDTIERVAGTDSTILITGETGSGKGLVARLIHDKSKRKDYKFVAFSCGAVPETLFESELFGHRKGAFTGAINDKKGLFDEANCGTLFLDDISNTPLAVQPKLLQAIEEKTIRRLGEIEERKVNVRLISATNQDLKKMMRKEQFRADLYYRIGVLPIHVPPLRERTIDIPLLADYFLKKYAIKMHRCIHGFDRKALKMMVSYSWPGNVRELQNIIERAVNLTHDQYISSANLRLGEGGTTSEKTQDNIDKIKEVLESAKGNVSEAASNLGIARCTLYRRMNRYGINVVRNVSE